MQITGQLYAPAALPPGKELVTHWIRGSGGGPRAGLNAVEYRKIPCPFHKWNAGHPAHSPSLHQVRYRGSLHATVMCLISAHNINFSITAHCRDSHKLYYSNNEMENCYRLRSRGEGAALPSPWIPLLPLMLISKRHCKAAHATRVLQEWGPIRGKVSSCTCEATTGSKRLTAARSATRKNTHQS
jgi:hypothetical protein